MYYVFVCFYFVGTKFNLFPVPTYKFPLLIKITQETRNVKFTISHTNIYILNNLKPFKLFAHLRLRSTIDGAFDIATNFVGLLHNSVANYV